MLSFNELIKGTISTKTRKSDLITNYIIDNIDNYNEDIGNNSLYLDYSQAIKRLLLYQTKNPIASESIDKEGKLISQPDINFSLLRKNDNNPQCIFNSSFDSEISVEEQNFLFVYNQDSDYTRFDEGWSKNIYCVHIVISEKYNLITDMETGQSIKRTSAIANLISDLFDNRFIDDDYIGNIKLKLIKKRYDRLSKNSDGVVCTLVFESKNIDSRSRI